MASGPIVHGPTPSDERTPQVDSETIERLNSALLRGMAQHLIYVNRVSATVDGADSFAGTEPTECALGKIILELDQQVRTRFSGEVSDQWAGLVAAHVDFHRTSHRALATHSREDMHETEMLSLNVVNRLHELEDSITRAVG